jgi:hypothetical protein
LAKAYGQLPSYVRDNATTYDVMVMDMMLSWEEQARNETSGIKSVPELTQEEMQAMLKRVKN